MKLISDWSQLATPRVCGLVTEKPTQLSRAMHTAAFSASGLSNFEYRLFDTRDTETALKEMQERGYRGYSLSIPHKESAIFLLDSLSEDAKAIGAVNTVINTGSSLHGFNTDWLGTQLAFEEAAIKIAEKSVLVLGAGGASKAALYALEKAGARELKLSNRNRKRAEEVAASFGAQVVSWSELSGSAWGEIDILINTTPIGSHLGSGIQYPFSFDELPQNLVLFDCVTYETALIQHGRAKGQITINGSRMLMYQALEQFRLFTEQAAPKDVMDQALSEELATMKK